MQIREKISSPWFIFIVYVAAASLIVISLRMVFPGEPSPLPVFSRDWRLNRGLLELIALFPALAFSALVIPFGQVSEISYTRFSSELFKRLVASIVTVICAAAIYTLLFFICLPMAKNAEGNMRFRGELYNLAKERLNAHVEAEEWLEASQFIGICDSAWENSPDLETVRAEVEIRLNEQYSLEAAAKARRPAAGSSADVSTLPGQRVPVDATDAIAMGQTAFLEGKYYDAHWLATLGGRIAMQGSLEETAAKRLASLAWNQIEAQRPGGREEEAFSTYRIKMDGYEAMISGDWIRAYYIFNDLNEKIPHDPDTENFLKISERGTKEIAFFMDEMKVPLIDTLTGTIFSLPNEQDGTRSVLRIAGFSSTPDYAYGIDIEYMAFDPQAGLLLSLQAPYAKFLPITLDKEHRVLVMMRTLDRNDPSQIREPAWEAKNDTVYHPDQAQVTLNVSYETFLVLSQLRQGPSGMQLRELFTTSRMVKDSGYISQVFEAEILNRFGSCFFLPIAVFAIVLGLRFHAKSRPRYFFVIMLPVLPVVFNVVAHLYRTLLNIAGISLILAFGFPTALIFFIVIMVSFFVFSLLLLAAHHS